MATTIDELRKMIVDKNAQLETLGRKKLHELVFNRFKQKINTDMTVRETAVISITEEEYSPLTYSMARTYLISLGFRILTEDDGGFDITVEVRVK
jgi:thiamine biosynthesis lipoprotein ApbE